MKLQAKKQMLIRDYGLDPDDFYVVNEKFGEKTIIRRTGIDKLELQLGMTFNIESLICTPYGNKVNVIVYGSGRTKDGDYVKALASANPDNCSYANYAETAEKRCRHKLILKLARLYQHDIFSQDEDESWSESRNNYQAAVNNVEKKINPTTDTKK